ncbi:glycosyltransferase [Chloroflexota bacterium]
MLSIIAPVYNEAGNLPTFIKAISNSLSEIEHEIIIVDDNSPDGTGKLADELAKEYDTIRVIHRAGKLGVASAIAEGVTVARGEVIGTINSDMQQPPELLPVMLEQIGEHDIVIGSRFVAGGHNEEVLWRRVVSKGAITMARVLLPQIRNVKDPVAGFFLFKREVVADAQMSPESLSGNVSIGIKFLPLLLVKGCYNSVIEVPYTFTRRKSGKSKFALRDYFKYIRFVLNLMKTSGEFKRVAKFCLIGGSGFATNMGLFILLTDKLDLYYRVSAICSWEITMIYMFIMNELWTFRDLRRSGTFNAFKRFLKFNILRLPNQAIIQATLLILTTLLGIQGYISNMIGIMIVMVWNYLASVNIIWRK